MSINSPQVGQRWMVDTDSSLGLGIVVDVDVRTATIDFPAVEEQRRYSLDNAPLTRVTLAVGDTFVTGDDQSYEVAAIAIIEGICIYETLNGDHIPETRLAATISLNHPLKRLLANQLDKPKWFDLRMQLAQGYHHWLQSDLAGLMGARITLTPHQLYVADAATALDKIRILLADEVGLGKTIEAGLILQRCLLQERVQQVLILVPEALQVQWFVELVRCFAIHAVLWHQDSDLNERNVFIASHDVLEDDTPLLEVAWDMVIIDEAHHFDLLDNSKTSQQLSQIGRSCEHLLLLSATPERMGLEQHFSRLQLLDSSRFHDFTQFQQQYKRYESVADSLEQLLQVQGSDNEHITQAMDNVKQALAADIPNIASIDQLDKLINILLDCHGTGRAVFRNTRNAISGFPSRQLAVHQPDIGSSPTESKRLWLVEFLRQHSDDKILLITYAQEDVLDLREWLFRKTGIDCPVFHEGMSLVERDRAAAWFADQQEGAPMLLCSEIGSEGRNFQFCRHLICWDLPEHPDILEQRIGRLDRIGQQHTVMIHVCVTDDNEQRSLDWYHSILDCVETTNPAAGALHDRWYTRFLEEGQNLAETVHQERQQILQQLNQGRDRLIEANSCRHPEASQLLDSIKTFEQDKTPEPVLAGATDLLNIHFESLGDHRFSLIPSDQMLVPLVPGVPAEGCEITFDRATAIAREDVQFVTWDHPLMQGLHELIDTSELGVSSIALMPNKALKPGTLFLEAMYGVTVKDAQALLIQPYLSQRLLRVVLSKGNQQNLHSALPQKTLATIIERADKNICKAVVKDYHNDIQALATLADSMVQTELQGIIQQSGEALDDHYHQEQTRLEQLQAYNPLIDEGVIESHKKMSVELKNVLTNRSQVEMSAIRIIVTYQPQKS